MQVLHVRNMCNNMQVQAQLSIEDDSLKKEFEYTINMIHR